MESKQNIFLKENLKILILPLLQLKSFKYFLKDSLLILNLISVQCQV